MCGRSDRPMCLSTPARGSDVTSAYSLPASTMYPSASGLNVRRTIPRLASVATTSRPRLARPTASWPVPHAQSRTRELGGRDFTRSPDAATDSAVVDSLRIKFARIAATTGPRDDSGCEDVVRGCCLLNCGQSVGVVTHHPTPPDHLGTVQAEIVSVADSRGAPR